jgi:hypothetical protein
MSDFDGVPGKGRTTHGPGTVPHAGHSDARARWTFGAALI